jgi:anti-anti-sigma regulatory factor
VVVALNHPEFTAQYGDDRVVLTGTADAEIAPRLQAWLLEVHAEGPHQPELVVDLERLELMSAGCIKGFVALIEAIQQGATSYRVRFVPNRAAAWQLRSLAALACLASNLVTIDG